MFRDDGKKLFSIHVLDDGLLTRYLRVHPTKNKHRFKINETLLGVEVKQGMSTRSITTLSVLNNVGCGIFKKCWAWINCWWLL